MSVAPSISLNEFATRQARARRAAADAGYDALLVVSRGGGSVDRYANVLYLANFYSSFPFIPDRRPDWSARGHPMLVLPTEGQPTLIVDMPVREAEIPVETIVNADDVIPAVVQVLKSVGLDGKRIGVAGADALPWAAARQIEQELPGARFTPADELLDRLRAVKSPAEIAILRRASAIGSDAIEAMMDFATAGRTHGEVMGVGMAALAREGAIMYNNFMSSGRGGNAPVMIATDFPTFASKEPLEDGQWFQIGLSGVYQGYYFDHSRSKAIGDRPTAPQIEAFEASIAAVESGIAAIRPGATAGEVARAGFKRLVELGFSPESDFSGLGHGIGLGWDAPWLVPDERWVLEPGMVLCVERSVEKHGHVGDFEETVLVTSTGAEKISKARIRRW
jgi:Xaa-Pro aminopeptidase